MFKPASLRTDGRIHGIIGERPGYFVLRPVHHRPSGEPASGGDYSMPSSASGPGKSSSCPCITDPMVSQQLAEKIQFPHRGAARVLRHPARASPC